MFATKTWPRPRKLIASTIPVANVRTRRAGSSGSATEMRAIGPLGVPPP
jgi:hypothetical protein